MLATYESILHSGADGGERGDATPFCEPEQEICVQILNLSCPKRSEISQVQGPHVLFSTGTGSKS
jgi:hypothetical protein